MSVLLDMDTPVFAAEGVPENTDPAGWRMRISGLAERPCEVGLTELWSLPPAEVDCRLTSVSGWTVRATWNGALWRDFVKSHPPCPGATHALFKSPGGYSTCVPLSDLDHPRVLWCRAVGGEPLEPRYGGPLRMVIPNLWGYKSCKWVAELEYADRMIIGYWEARGYSASGKIEPGATMDINSGRRRTIGGGEVTDF